MKKPQLSFVQIWNMSFGFLGIQFGWGLQMANMSAIYQYLGADPSQLAILWLAAPVTGLLVQPIVGYLSDRTWNRLGRRRPYFLVGAIFASLALIAMPNSSALWMAAGLLWILDASVNVSMEPFRAFVADKLPKSQHKIGYTTQSILIGFGAVVSSAMPWMLTNWFGMTFDDADGSGIPLAVKISFYIGAAVFMVAVLWTIISTDEYPPEDMEAFLKHKEETKGFLNGLKEVKHGIMNMPKTMQQLAVVQFFTWLALFCMWIYFGIGIATKIFGGVPGEIAYAEGIAWGGLMFSVYNGVAFGFAFLLLGMVKVLSAKNIHTICLLIGGFGLISVNYITDANLLIVSMIAVGIAWASILSMPYAILAGSLPVDKTGFYMGIFNFFIVIPQIVVALFLGSLIVNISGGNELAPVLVGGGSLILAAITMRFVQEPEGLEANLTSGGSGH
jgi:maltose/moltooligosaccharide transporter